MNTTTALIINGILSLATIGALAALVRLAFTISRTPKAKPETLHPSQPIPLRVAIAHEESELVRAA
jgi:hypothetical protein